MPSFLEKTAHYLLDHYRSDLSEICIVLPNRRAGLFLRKFLAAGITQPVWSPLVFSIEDFMSSLSGLKEIDPVFLLVELFDIHQAMDKEKSQPFDEFLNWGPQLLADFNEIDRYLADAKYLFAYLDEIRAINLWNLDKTPLTEFQQNYLKFYQSLFGYYSRLTDRLMARGEGYQGLLFRQACVRLEAKTVEIPWRKIIFVGFNALTTAEERAMKFLHQEGKADFLWDADHYYLDQKQQEAGSFLRRWFSAWPMQEKNWISEDYLRDEKIIEIIGVPDVIGQVKLCGELLQETGRVLDEHTAIVLPDEKLLLPLLNSFPGEVMELNVTMGLPLQQTPMADLLDIVFQMHIHASGKMQNSSGGKSFYYREVLKVLQHPYVPRIAGQYMHGNHFVLGDMQTRIRSGRQVFICKEDLSGDGLFDAGVEFMDCFFSPWKEPDDAIRDLQKIVDLVKDTAKGATSLAVEGEYAFAFARILHQLKEIVNQYPAYFSWPTFYKFFRQLIDSTALPFYGEPLKGVQVMGMLETRTLDFDQLIILSCNEGLIPSGKMAHSFIPFDIKREFGLPTYQHKDAVYAYHFYRLLQRAKKVWLIYSTEADPLGGGERSRFIQQIFHELPAYNPKVLIRERFLNSPLPKGIKFPAIIIPKNGNTLDILLKKATDGLSPTALNAFRKCSLRFYFSEISRLKEPDELEDEIDAKALGNTVHQVLFQLFDPIKKQVIRMTDLESMSGQVENMVKATFKDKYSNTALAGGKNLLLVNVACIMVRNFLKSEISRLETLKESGLTLTITMLEQYLYRSVFIESGGKILEVKIKGVVDRIERIGDESFVLDYKTGNTDRKELLVKSWEDLLHDPVLDKGFQLITYAWLLSKGPNPQPVKAGIISLKKPGTGIMMLQTPGHGEAKPAGKSGETGMVEFEDILKNLMTEMLDINVPFRPTDDGDLCLKCPYIAICGR